MSEKPDYYQVLGVDKKASKADIKSAYQRIAMKNHPDMVKNKPWPQAEKDAAVAKFKQATEAEAVLSDDAKRAAYDQYGHKGVENLSAGKSASSGQSYADAAGPRMKRTYSEDDTFSFFEKRAEREKTAGTGVDDGLTAEQRRERARQERLARRGRGNEATTTPTVKEPFDDASSGNVFHDIAENVTEATEALKGGVTVPFEVLEKFRDNLQDFVREVDKAIARSRPPGPKHS